MGLRIALLAVLAIGIGLVLVSRKKPAPAPVSQPDPPPLLSVEYRVAMRGVMALEPSDVERLQRELAANPDEIRTRLKLMAYHQRGDREPRPEDRRKRFQHALWVIQHHPDSEVLHAPVARFIHAQLQPGDLERAAELWEQVTQSHQGDAAVLFNAASFFEDLNPTLHLQYLEATAAADANHPFALRPLARIYANAILTKSFLAPRAQAALESSQNPWILGNVAYELQSSYNVSRVAGHPDQRAAQLAEHYFTRAKAINPNLQRATILPAIDLAAIEKTRQAEEQKQRDLQAQMEKGAAAIPRLPISAFPSLPPAVAGVLRARGCTVPQPFPKGEPRNVIHGEFFAKGQEGWAVLCSVKESTALLVFRNSTDTHPDTINTTEDRGYLQDVGDQVFGYSRQISAVNRNFIVGHYRAYGGPQPPPIDHQGIDDAILQKASTTWYFYGNKWMALQGAD